MTDKYFEWMYNMVTENLFAESISYRKLLTHLYTTEFRWSVKKDINRAKDGVDLRRRFSIINNLDEPVIGECNVFEMMLALAIRCEETIMDDPEIGDRTCQWFWKMISNLDLRDQFDKFYDEEYVDGAINRFLDREYETDGTGGLFKIYNTSLDFRTAEIWSQLNWYLNTIS